MEIKCKKAYVITLVMLSIFSFSMLKVNADSGWDSSYDSGSWDSSYDNSWSSSDWSSSSSESSSTGGASNKTNYSHFLSNFILSIVLLVTGVLIRVFCSRHRLISNVILILSGIFSFIASPPLIMMVLIVAPIFMKGKQDENRLINNYNDISNEELNKYVDIDVVSLKKEFYEKFVDIQKAWMEFDYDSLRKLCGDEIYNTYFEELEALKLKDEQNVMSDFNTITDKIISVAFENGIVTVSYYLDIKFYDYVINNKTNKVIKGNKYNKVHNQYILKFTMSKNDVPDRCPNCNAPLELSENSTCVYCNSVIVKNTSNFVLLSKRRIN